MHAASLETGYGIAFLIMTDKPLRRCPEVICGAAFFFVDRLLRFV